MRSEPPRWAGETRLVVLAIGAAGVAVAGMFLAMDPLGVVVIGAAMALGDDDPRPVFLAAGSIVVLAAGGGWAAGPRACGRSCGAAAGVIRRCWRG